IGMQVCLRIRLVKEQLFQLIQVEYDSSTAPQKIRAYARLRLPCFATALLVRPLLSLVQVRQINKGRGYPEALTMIPRPGLPAPKLSAFETPCREFWYFGFAPGRAWNAKLLLPWLTRKDLHSPPRFSSVRGRGSMWIGC